MAYLESSIPLARGGEYVRTALNLLVAEGLRVALETVLAAEADGYVARHRGARDARGRALVARNGFARERSVPLGPVSVTLRAPRVHVRRRNDGMRHGYVSAILPPGRPPIVGGAHRLVAAYVRACVSGDFSFLSEHLANCGIAGATAATEALARGWLERRRGVADLRFASVAADAVPCFPPLDVEHDAKRALVLVGVLTSGRLHVIDMAIGDLRSSADWAKLLEGARALGLGALPEIENGSAPAFFAAAESVDEAVPAIPATLRSRAG